MLIYGAFKTLEAGERHAAREEHFLGGLAWVKTHKDKDLSGVKLMGIVRCECCGNTDWLNGPFCDKCGFLKQKVMPVDISKVVSENFWDLV